MEVEACDLRAEAPEAGHTELSVVSAQCLVGGLWGLLVINTVLLQPSLLCPPAPSLPGDGNDSGPSDSEESVFSGLQDSGSDSGEDATTEGEDGASSDEGHRRTERTAGQPVQVGEQGPSWWALFRGGGWGKCVLQPQALWGACTAFSRFPWEPQSPHPSSDAPGGKFGA